MRNPNRETIFRFQRFSVENRRSAMKVGTDGVLLGAWAELPPVSEAGGTDGSLRPRILDVGAGTGLVSLMLAQRFPAASVSAIEIDADSAEECAANFRQSPWSARLDVVKADFLSEPFGRDFHLIVSNPPFFNNGAKAPDEARHAARHEDSLPLATLIERAASLLAPGAGSLALVLPADRRADAESAAAFSRLRLWRGVVLTTVPGKAPRRVLLQFVNSGAAAASISAECLASTGGPRSPWHRELVKDFYLNP